jgi:hypothetical protein
LPVADQRARLCFDLGSLERCISSATTALKSILLSSLGWTSQRVSVTDSLGCAADTMFTVLYDFVEEEKSSAEFIVDWKEGVLNYRGSELIFDIEIFNSIGQLIYTKSALGPNESIRFNMAPQTLYISSSKGNSRTKVVLR